MPVDDAEVKELLRLKGEYLFHREGQELEFKEQFSFAGLAEYFRDFAAFANNRGGFLIFGVQDSPRVPVGLNEAALDQFERIDPAEISGYLLETFSPDVHWEMEIVEYLESKFGVFYVPEARLKPVVSKKDLGRAQEIRNGDIYYRYGGRTQRIQYAELEHIIVGRVADINRQWQDLVQKIGQAGPSNAAILDTERSIIEKDDSKILVLDEDLVEKLKFIKSGEFDEQEGGTALQLVGDVVPVDQVEVVRQVEANRLKRYPYSAMEIAHEVKQRLPQVKQYEIWDAIKENNLKDNPDYSVYNFRSKAHQDLYEETGEVTVSTPSIYNEDALDFIARVLSDEEE
jgi:hypothetical protein